jgi:hypothetical protein
MTNKEMAAELGRLIIHLRQRGRALESVLTECCDPAQIPWGSRVHLAEQDAQSQAVSASERQDMLQSIAAQTDEIGLIRALYSQFLQKGPTEGIED